MLHRPVRILTAILLVGLAACGSEAADVAVSPSAPPVSTPTPSPDVSEAPYWDEARLAELESAKAQFTPPPVTTYNVTSSQAAPAPAPVVAEPVVVAAPVAATTPRPAPTVEPTPTTDEKLADGQFLELARDVMDRYQAKELTTKQAIDALRAIQEEEDLTELQLILLEIVVQDLKFILEWEEQEQQGQWNFGDINVPTLYEVRHRTP